MRLILAILGLFSGLANAQTHCANLKVGVITGLSGAAQVWGNSIKNGLEMGREESGCETLKFLYEDDQFVPTKTVSAFKKLVESDRVDVVIVSSSTAGNTVAPLAEKAKVPLFAWASDPNVARGKRYTIRTWASSETEGRILAKRAHLHGHKRVAFIRTTHDYSDSIFRAFSADFKDIPVVEEFASDVQDFRPAILKAKSQKVDGVATCMVAPGQAGLLARQMRDLGLAVPLFGCQTFEFHGEFEASDGAFSGVWFNGTAADPAFLERYETRFGKVGTAGGAAMHFDLALILAQTSARGIELIEQLAEMKLTPRAILEIKFKRENSDQFLDTPVPIHRYRADGKIEPAPEPR